MLQAGKEKVAGGLAAATLNIAELQRKGQDPRAQHRLVQHLKFVQSLEAEKGALAVEQVVVGPGAVELAAVDTEQLKHTCLVPKGRRKSGPVVGHAQQLEVAVLTRATLTPTTKDK